MGLVAYAEEEDKIGIKLVGTTAAKYSSVGGR